MENRKSTINLKEDVLFAKGLLDAGTPMYIFDLETTGLNPNSDRILSFSAIKIIMEDNISKIVDEIDLLLNPGFHIPDKVSEINGIYDEDVRDCPKEEEIIGVIKEFWKETPFVAGYNSIKFDEKFVNAMYLRCLGEKFSPLFHLDVMSMGKEKVFLKSYKLENLAKELGADIGLTFHKSIDDVIATYRCYDILRHDYELPEEEKVLEQANIRDIQYWEGPRWNLRRIYISAQFPHNYDKIYYDIIRKEWVSDNDKIDLEDLKNKTLARYGANDEKDLINKVKAPA